MNPTLPFLPTNSPLISSAFHPIQIRHQSTTNLHKSTTNSLLQKSPLLLQNEIERRLHSSVFNNSGLTNKDSSIPQKLGSTSGNGNSLQLNSFSPSTKNNGMVPNKITINQNFFQMDPDVKKPNILGEINTFLFDANMEKKIKDNNKNGKMSIFFTKDLGNGKHRTISLVKEEEDDIKNPENNNNQRKEITNVINNNYYIQVNQKKKKKSLSLLQKKRGRKAVKSLNYPTTKSRKLKKKDKTQISLYLNQIKIQGITLHKFPLIKVPHDCLSVNIFQRMLTEESYFEYEEKNNAQNYTYSHEKLNKKCFLTYFNRQLSMYSVGVVPIEENKNVSDPYLLLKNFYSKIQQTVLQIQKNFIGKKKSSLNKELCIILHKLIQSCNVIIDIIIGYKPVGFKKIKIVKNKIIYPLLNVSKLKKLSNYQCPFCHKIFEKGQGLGGHMSRHHPKQSEKYKEKMEIREKRTHKRNLLFEIKTKFFELYKKNYKELLDKGAKHEIHSFLMEHKLEYLMYKKREQKKARMNRSEIVEDMKRNEAKKFNVVDTKESESINKKDNNNLV